MNKSVLTFYAHSKEGCATDQWQTLQVHLKNVGKLTSQFSAVFGAKELGELVGKCHDIGKAHPEWQRYLKGETSNKPDHRLAGAMLIAQKAPHIAALPVLGHHGGLESVAAVKAILSNASSDDRIVEIKERFLDDFSNVNELPDFLKADSSPENKRTCEFFIRMLFSALVDADFLDTESFIEPVKAAIRENISDLGELFETFEKSQKGLDSTGRLNKIRSRIYKSVMEAAHLAPGLFSLSIPTGGGKTRTAMGFALKHALHHNLDRIIVVIPYTSIIEQTAKEYRKIFGNDAVVEHHSSLDPDRETEWNRLASENWDAPIVVTTSVQFFDSLHSNKPSSCRKLHNIAHSVVILDEVQTLPPELLAPTLDVMRELAGHYKTSFLFSTATQPAFSDRRGFNGLQDVRELAPDAHGLFKDFRRVSYQFPEELQYTSWEKLAHEIAAKKQVLAIVNTKKDAKKLFKLLGDETNFHLSSSMCPAHRRMVLEEVSEKLERGMPCRLVSTQVVEAGVDIDFPTLYRAFGPMDSIVQAAGRCNREGKLDEGHAIIFQANEAGMPPGVYQTASDLTRTIIAELDAKKFETPAFFQDYFAKLYNVTNLDARNILGRRARMDYPETARNYHLINAGTHPVLVPWRKGAQIAENIIHKPYLSRNDFSMIQNYSVNLWSNQLTKALEYGLCSEIRSGLFEWIGEYDAKLGIVMKQQDLAKFVC